MKQSSSRILTTHVGSLPRPRDLIELYRDTAATNVLEARLTDAVADVVREQHKVGIDIVNDGEFGKPSTATVDYAAWWTYIYDRISGFEVQEGRPDGNDALSFGSRDRVIFRQFYEDELGLGSPEHKQVGAGRVAQLTCNAEVKYAGQRLIKRDIANLKAAIGTSSEDAFITAVSPATMQILPNEFYSDRRDYVWALAEAIHEEYMSIVDAGFILQVDDPAIVDLYDWWFSLAKDAFTDYRDWAELQVEALNHALEGIPPERVRFHVCWGSWHGPHSTDVPLQDVVDLLLRVNVGAYVIEAANARHEHEWKVWRDVAHLPEGRVLIPGVVSHATNVLEHPELVADRLVQYAEVVGRENVIAGTDCGLGGRIHPQLAWAKLKTLSEGARLASSVLWHG